jgi:hypothetical protein
VLTIEDDETTASDIAGELRKRGGSVDWIDNGREGMACAMWYDCLHVNVGSAGVAAIWRQARHHAIASASSVGNGLGSACVVCTRVRRVESDRFVEVPHEILRLSWSLVGTRWTRGHQPPSPQ